MKFKLSILILIVSLMFAGCAEIKPMTLPEYSPPDLSSIKRPEIPVPQEGKDYTINTANGTVTYTISGQNLLTTKVISEKAAWAQVEMLIQMVNIQSEIIKQKDALIIVIDLKRQYEEKQVTKANVEKYVSWVIEIILLALLIAK